MSLIDEDYKDYKPELVNRQYEEAHAKIFASCQDLTDENGKAPTFLAISEQTGYHINTIYRHFRRMRASIDIKPKYGKYAFEVINKHLELMRQKDDLAISLKATLALEERLFDMGPQETLQIENHQQKRLVIEISDKRKADKTKVLDIQDAEVEVIDDKVNKLVVTTKGHTITTDED